MKPRHLGKTVIKQYQVLLMILPAFAWLVIFQYYPLWGWHMAFVEYKLGRAFLEQPFVGLRYFIELFRDFRFYNALTNTVIMSVLHICINSLIMRLSYFITSSSFSHPRFRVPW